MLQVKINWSALPGGSAVNILHFNGGDQSAATAAGNAVQAWLGRIKGGLIAGATAAVDPVITVVTPDNGENIGYLTFNPTPQVGTITNQPLPQASQMVHQIKTGVVRNGRLIQGRIFLPGLSTEASVGGEVSTTYRTNFGIEAQPLIAAGLGVWSRPGPGGSGGVFAPAASVTIWREWGMMGKRRS